MEKYLPLAFGKGLAPLAPHYLGLIQLEHVAELAEEDFGRTDLQLLPLLPQRGDDGILLRSPQVASPSSSFGRQLAKAAVFRDIRSPRAYNKVTAT